MTKLSFSHDISEKREFGKKVVNQTMVVSCCYDPDSNEADNIEVRIYENGKHVAEISKLLHKAEGSPLYAMMDAINWQQVYADKKESSDFFENEIYERGEA